MKPRPILVSLFAAAQSWRALLVGAGVMLGLLVTLGILAQRNFARLAEANNWSLHTYKVLGKIDGVSQVLDAREAQLRGFTLTGDPLFLERLRAQNGAGLRALREVRALNVHSEKQQQRLRQIEPALVDYNRRFLAPYVTDVENSPDTFARLRERIGAQTATRSQKVNELQARLREMEITERRLLATRALELQRAQTIAGYTLVAGSAFTALLAVGLLALLGNSLRRQRQSARELSALNASLVAEVSERRVAEESLRASEIGFRHLAEDSLDLICRHAPDGTLTYVSPAAWPLLGYSPIEMIGLRLWHFQTESTRAALPPCSQEEAVQRFAATLRNTKNKPLLRSFRHANGDEVWLEAVGHSIVDAETGEVRAWHTTSRDVSRRVRDDRDRARLLRGLRAVVELADELIGAPDEATLLQRAVVGARRRLHLGRCSIFLSDAPGLPTETRMRGTWGTDENGAAVCESELIYDTQIGHSADDVTPGPGERWIVRRNQTLYHWRNGERVALPEKGWIARTLISTRDDVQGLFFHDAADSERPHEAVEQELVSVFCSLLGALLERGRTQERMMAQQKLLETVVENAPIFLYSVDKNEQFTVAAGQVLPVLGFDPKAMVGHSLEEVAGNVPLTMQSVRRALEGEVFEEEILFNERWLKMWRHPLRAEDGEIRGMIGLGMDITREHESETKLRASEMRYRQVADSLQEVLFQTDSEDRWSFLNPAWREITGFEIADTLGTPCVAVLFPEDRAAFENLFATARARATFDDASPILRFQTRDGQVRWMEINLRASFDAEGNLRGTAGTLSDVSQRVHTENRLRETLEMKRAILHGASYAIVATDASGIIRSFNPAAEQLFGVSAQDVIDRAQPLMFHDRAEIQARAVQLERELGIPVTPDCHVLVARARHSMDKSEDEWTCVHADGTRFPMRISHAVLRGEDGEITGYVAIGYDLSEARRAEKLKDEFISVVSHELRTPLTSIRGALELLGGGIAGELPPAAQQMIEIARKNADRLVLLINDILDIEKIANGKMRFEMTEIALHELLETALETNRSYAQTLGVTLQLEPLAPVLKNAILRGDEARLQQVLSNLISNACKWTPADSEVLLRAELGTGSMMLIEVRDAGPGVPPEFVPRLFERFAQADGSATRGKGGTGLGLSITQAILENHGSRIYYQAPEPHCAGATFGFELQAQLAPVAPEQTRGRMLVVEDDADVAAVLQAILEDAGYAVEVAASGAQALALAQGDVAFAGATLDLHLPDDNGLDLLGKLRALPATRDLPVVVVSSFCDEGAASAAPFAVKNWLSKPVEAEQLLAAVSQFDGAPKARVLHIEDDADIRRVTELILDADVEIVGVATLAQARARLQCEKFDLALLDIGLPDGNGLELLPLLEAKVPPIPVILFSAREEEAETVSSVAAALIKSRTPNETLRTKVEELLTVRAALG